MKKNQTSFTVGMVLGAIAFFILLTMVLKGISSIGIGQVGIVKHMDGQVTEIGEGVHWVGWGVGVQQYPTYTQALILSNNNYEGGNANQEWTVGTADQQELPVNTSLTWRINPNDATDVYQSVGGQNISYIANNIVEPTMKMIVNEVTHEYDYNSLRGPQLPQASEEINKDLSNALSKDGIIIEKFGFTYVGLPQGMASAQSALAAAEIEQQKAAAAQKAQIISNKTLIMTAQAQAQANEIESKGLKAKANALSTLLVQEDAVKQWNGILPSTVVTGSSGAMPFGIPTTSTK
jgi:regulator of protease activity HflC (stomatin/prohibitin superfamily)